MQTPPEITFHGINSSPHIEALARAHLAKLERHYDRITTVRVAIEEAHHHAGHDRGWQVRIEIGVPGTELVINQDPGRDRRKRDLDATLRDAFKAARRRLDTWAAKRRGEVKQHEEQPVGMIVDLHPQEDYGFVRTLEGREIYFTANAVVDADFAELEDGQRVRFVEGREGVDGPMATTVRPIG